MPPQGPYGATWMGLVRMFSYLLSASLIYILQSHIDFTETKESYTASKKSHEVAVQTFYLTGLG